MKENTQEKNLVDKNGKGIFSKIKNFFKNFFNKKDKTVDVESTEETTIEVKENNGFKENIKMVEIEESELLKLQKKFQTGAIAEGDLTDQQIDALVDLYDKQILKLQKAIELVKQEIEKSNEKKNA